MQIGHVDAEPARRLGVVSASGVQRLRHDLLFGFTQGRVISERTRRGRCTFPDSFGKVVHLDLRIRSKHYGSFNGILQFAYVSWPFVLLDQFPRLWSHAEDSAFATLAGTGEKEICQQRNIFAAFAER